MRRLMLLIVVCLVGAATSAYAQDAPYAEFVSEVRGDTLVVKTYSEMDNNPNALVNAISSDSIDVPEGRVYMLKRGGWYPIIDDLVTPQDRHIRIVGEGDVAMVQGNPDDHGYPAIFSGIDTGENNNNGDMLQYQGDVTLKNVAMTPADNEGGIGWTFLYASAPNHTVWMDNVLFETTLWVFMQSNDYAGSSLIVEDSYFVNMIGEPCRRNGGVYDNVSNNTDTLMVENSTHVMGAGVTYKMRSYPVNKAFFNHNTFVNISGQVLASWGHQSDYIVSNNLFVNANVQGYIPGLDYNEFDQDYLPHGLINIDSLRTTRGGGETFGIDSAWVRNNTDVSVSEFGPDDRKVLVSHNGVYWDSKMDEIVQRLNENNVPCPVDESASDCLSEQGTWVSQAIKMNSRTKAMFDADNDYPYLTEGPWVEDGAPEFTEPAGLMSDELQNLVDWSVNAAGSPGERMDHWRADNNPLEGQGYLYADFPVLADLSYSNQAYLEGGMYGMPLGDLNWFPDEKATWESTIKTQEHNELESAKNEGRIPTAIESIGGGTIPSKVALKQNYPNPFNPTTRIEYQLQEAANVTISIYNTLGRKVATLVNNEMQKAGSYALQFDAANLSSGVYIYELEAGDVVKSKTMMLIK